jgi:hypothetical protein
MKAYGHISFFTGEAVAVRCRMTQICTARLREGTLTEHYHHPITLYFSEPFYSVDPIPLHHPKAT